MKVLDTINNLWGLVAIGAVFAAGYAALMYEIRSQADHLMQYTETATTYWDTTIKQFDNDVDEVKRLINETRQETIDNRNRSVAAQDVVQENTAAMRKAFSDMQQTLNQLTIVMIRIEERLK